VFYSFMKIRVSHAPRPQPSPRTGARCHPDAHRQHIVFREPSSSPGIGFSPPPARCVAAAAPSHGEHAHASFFLASTGASPLLVILDYVGPPPDCWRPSECRRRQENATVPPTFITSRRAAARYAPPHHPLARCLQLIPLVGYNLASGWARHRPTWLIWLGHHHGAQGRAVL
jgi:hypothetical protein